FFACLDEYADLGIAVAKGFRLLERVARQQVALVATGDLPLSRQGGDANGRARFRLGLDVLDRQRLGRALIGRCGGVAALVGRESGQRLVLAQLAAADGLGRPVVEHATQRFAVPSGRNAAAGLDQLRREITARLWRTQLGEARLDQLLV